MIHILIYVYMCVQTYIYVCDPIHMHTQDTEKKIDIARYIEREMLIFTMIIAGE